MNMILLFSIFVAAIMSERNYTDDKIKFLALGDSYTIGEGAEENQRWPVQLAEALRKKGLSCQEPEIIAKTGWRTDDLKRAIIAADPTTDYDLVSLLIGVNNQYQGKTAESYAPEFEELLKMSISFARGDKSKVIVLSIPDYGYTPFGKEKRESISKSIEEYNNTNRAIAKKYSVKYFNITDISRKGAEDLQLIADDGLHPSGKQYMLWIELIASGVFEIFGEITR
jgi:lysophospholipase L1-like esterase